MKEKHFNIKGKPGKTLALLTGLMLSKASFGGGGPQNVLVVVNQNSPNSQELGQYYQQARGIPDQNLFRVNVVTSNTISPAVFTNDLYNPVLNYIATSGLSNQIDYIVFSMDIPYRISKIASTHENGLSGAMFYGYKDLSNCAIPTPDTVNDYYAAHTAFAHTNQPSAHRYYITTMLSALDFDQARTLVDRSIVADHAFPTGTVYLLHGSNLPRNVRWPQFEDADFTMKNLPINQTRAFEDVAIVSGRTNVVGILTGAQNVFATLLNNAYAPGALGDHLTSYGGALFDPPGGQMSILRWIEAGCVGSYGTVTEPCNFTIKFPLAYVHYWYASGFNMGESYWMSVRNPYQGIFVGDPLCAPYAKPPQVDIANVMPGAIFSGTTNLCFTATEGLANRKVSRLDLFIDDLLVGTLTNSRPTAGNRISVVIEGITNSYVVNAGDRLNDITTGLAANVDAGHPNISAIPVNDRIEFHQKAIGTAGSNILYSVAVETNTGSELTLCALAANNRFIETCYPARKDVFIGGVVDPGDQLRTVITRLDNVKVTNLVTATGGETIQELLQTLQTQMDNDTNLQVSTGCRLQYIDDVNPSGNTNAAYFIANTNHWSSTDLHLDFDAIGLDSPDVDGNFTNNQDVMSARGMIFLAQGRDQIDVKYPLDTTQLTDGFHTLRVVAYDGTAVQTQGDATLPFYVSNQVIGCTITNLVPHQSFLLGSTVPVKIDAFTGIGAITSIHFYVEGRLWDTTNSTQACFSYDTLEFGVGQITVQAKAYADNGAIACSPSISIKVYRDNDSDSLPDAWEWEMFGDESLYTGVDDPDGDQVSNEEEFEADTEPLGSNSFLRILAILRASSNTNLSIWFTSRDTRNYTIEENTTLTNNANWMPAFPGPIPGQPDMTEWSPSVFPIDPRMFYRVRTQSP